MRAMAPASVPGDLARDPAAWGLVCALPEELGFLPELAHRRQRRDGVEVLEIDCGGPRLFACVGGVGPSRASLAASALLAAGARRGLLVAGVCGGLRQHLVPGTLVHCRTTLHADRERGSQDRSDADERLRRAWQAVAPGAEGWFLSAARPVLSLARRRELGQAFEGDCVADMETAAVAAVARAAGLPWAALRAVTDRASRFGALAFKLHYPSQAGRAADTVPALLASLERAASA
jgi:nucleoside phosphorylase